MAQPASPIARTRSEFIVNGKKYQCDHEARTTLWEVLSERLGLTGTVRSCNKATCGVCTVLVQDMPVYSCHYLAIEAAGKDIFTIEGLSDGTHLHPLQEIGYNHNAAQCGYCTAGWLVASKSLLDRNPNPTADDVRSSLVGHLCRCGSYGAILRTVMEAAEAISQGISHTGKEPKTDHTLVISQPVTRDYATGGGHLPGDWLVEGEKKIKTRKWLGYTPKDTKVLGTAFPPLRQVSLPRYLGKAEYATRVVLPDMLYLKFLRSPHAHARIKNIETSIASKLPGVVTVLTYKNIPKVTIPLPCIGMREELQREGEIVAIVAADNEDLAEDAIDAIKVEYEVLPSMMTVAQALSPGAPKFHRDGNLVLETPGSLGYDPEATMHMSNGDLRKAFAESDIVREFSYSWAGTNILPMQSNSGVAKWNGDELTFWGYGQDIYATRSNLSKTLGVPEEKIRYIDMYNGGTFGGTGPLGMAVSPMSYYGAYVSKISGRPVKYALTKEEELVERRLKAETVTTFKIGAKKDGTMKGFQWTHQQLIGDCVIPSPMSREVIRSNLMTGVTLFPWDNVTPYCHNIQDWEVTGYLYKSNSSLHGCNRSCAGGQEVKWGLEQAMDEMAEAIGIDPVEFRVKNMAKPGQKMPAKQLGQERSLEAENGMLTFDSFAADETLQEGADVFQWKEKKTHETKSEERFRHGVGVAFSDHHAGGIGYVRGEVGFGGTDHKVMMGDYVNNFSTRVEIDKDGNVTIKDAIPDSGTDHDTPIAMLVAEILGYTNLDHIRMIWGDSSLAPPSGKWIGGRSTLSAGSAACQAADWIRSELLEMASKELGANILELEIKDGEVFLRNDSTKKISFSALVMKAGNRIGSVGEYAAGGGAEGRALTRAPGSVFVEVEVDTWTGKVRVLNVVCCTDAGNLINPLTAESDQDGAVIQGIGNAFERIPWDLESHDHLLAGMGYLSYPIPTIKEFPEKITQIFINSYEPRSYFGFKAFTETIISAVPAAVANAVYNATGIRIRDHPITPAKIVEGMRELALNKN